jgi:hypothetical protein
LSLREPVRDKDDSLTALPMAEPMSGHLLVVLIDRRLGLQGERTHFIQRCLDDPHLNGITPPVHSRRAVRTLSQSLRSWRLHWYC